LSNHNLLGEALTHPSVKGSTASESTDQARLEYLGDSVLGLIIAKHLYENHKSMSEGRMTLIRQNLVNEKSLAEAARSVSLGKWLTLQENSESLRDKDSVLADTFEAILGAIFLDQGLPAATRFVMKVSGPAIDFQGVGRGGVCGGFVPRNLAGRQ
jgi:ribonuclease-3